MIAATPDDAMRKHIVDSAETVEVQVHYVLSNDQFDPRMFLAGKCDLPIGEGLVVSSMIFNAHPFETEVEAHEMAEALPGRWVVSEVGESGATIAGAEV